MTGPFECIVWNRAQQLAVRMEPLNNDMIVFVGEQGRLRLVHSVHRVTGQTIGWQATIPLPEELDPCDGYDHNISARGDSAQAAVDALASGLRDLRKWASDAIDGKGIVP